MNRMNRLLTIAATCACSLSFLADLAQAQGQPQPAGGGNGTGGNNGGRGGRGGNNGQPGNNGGNNGGQRGGGFGGGMFGGGGGRGMFEPSVTTEELDRYGKMLNMTKSQSEAAKALYDAYEHEYTTAATKAQDEMAAIREEARDDPSRMQDIGELFTKFRAKRTAMETSFFNDVKATLTPEQANTWPAVERVRRRETTMNRGLMAGERADLVKIVDGLKLAGDARKPLDPILDLYQVDLDRELIVRNEVQDKMQGNFRDLMGGDPAKAQKAFDEGRSAGAKVRDVNKRYARQVEAALPDDATKAKFNDVLRRESYPQIYRGQSYAARVAEAAVGLDGLSAEQKTSINEIKDRFTRDYSALNQKMETAYSTRESAITFADISSRIGGGGGGGGGGGRGGFGMVDSEELTTLRDQRRELENTTVEKIQALLNEDQKAKLPSQRGNGNGNGGGAGGGDGGNGGGRNNRNRPANNQPAPNGRT